MSPKSRPPYVIITKHALDRARERFNYMKWKSNHDIKRILIAIACKGQPYGESAIVGEYYMMGRTYTNNPIILSMREDRNDPLNRVVTSVLTAGEAHNAGPWRRSD